MTITLTETKEMVVKGKVERPLPTVTFDIKQEEFFKLYLLVSNPTKWDKQIDALLSKQGGVCTYYECARNMAIV